MKSAIFQLLVIVSSFISVSCSIKQADMDVDKVKEEINSRKIRRVTDAQIVQAAYDSGKVIVEQITIADLACDQALALDNEFVVSGLLVCDSTSLKDPKEVQIWSAYKYNYQNGLAMKDNIQKTGDSILLYTLPVKNAELTEKSTSPRVFFLRLSRKRLILSM